MLLQRLSPDFAVSDFRRELDRLFEGIAAPFNGGFARGSGSFPAINVWEDGDFLYAEAEIPGVTMEDIEVCVVGDELCIKGQRKQPSAQNLIYHRQERGTGEFSRFLTLPMVVNPDKVEAVLKNGVLTVKLPKADEAKPRRIEVKTQ